MNNGLRCRRVMEDDDFDRLTHLVYSADPYLYQDLFGNEDTARCVLRYLFFNPESIFYFKNYYVVELDDQLVGMAAFYKNNPKWNAEDVKEAFFQANAQIPRSFYAVSEYFETTFNHMNVGINACNIVVDENYRRRGIASALIEYVLKLSGNSPIELNVIADNTAAVGLYRKYGFIVIDEFFDYGGFESPKICCYRMLHSL